MALFGPENFKLKDGSEVVIRNLTAADAPACLDFYDAISSETTHTLKDGQNKPPLEACAKMYEEEKADALALRLGVFFRDKMIANLGFYANRASHPWLRHIARFGMGIRKEYWSQGLGSRLLEIMEAHALANSFARIEAEVRTKNEQGVALYRKAGFEIEGTRRSAAFINGEYQDEYHIGKLLGGKSSWVPPVLETERLKIRPVRMEDAKDLFEYASNEKVSQFVTWDPHQNLQESREFLYRALAGYKKQIPNPFAITLRNADQMLGTTGAWWSGAPENGCMELGYAISEKYWGNGYVAEASRAVMEYIFRNYPVERVQARCIAENDASARVMEKLGMRYEGTMRSIYHRKGRQWDLKLYAVLKHEFLS